MVIKNHMLVVLETDPTLRRCGTDLLQASDRHQANSEYAVDKANRLLTFRGSAI